MKKKIIYNGVETNYSITDDGKVFNDIRGNELKGTMARNEYKSVQLTINKKLVTLMIHRLVAEAFCPNPNNYSIVDHVDKNKTNNNANNLRWVTNKENNNNVNPRIVRNQGRKIENFDPKKWKQIKSSLYYINKQGQIYNSSSKKLLVGSLRNGYRRININGAMYSIHRLVWENYIGEIPEGMVIDHIDGNRENNCLENLRCVSQKENIKNSYNNRQDTVKIKQIDKDNNEIRIFNSIQEAADAMGVTHAAIRSAEQRKGTCKGYYWKRIE